MFLAEIQEPPDRGLILLTGPPGAGKSTFSHQVVLNSMVAERPMIFVTTEQTPSRITGALGERGMGRAVGLSFVDAFTETVGLTCKSRPDTICADSADLNSLSIAITKLQERIGEKGTLLVLDSLTSPYLLCGVEAVKFVRLFLSKFAAEGNSVLALVDEGCGRPEDLVAMMSIADGVIKMEIQDNTQFLNVVKHAKMRPTRIEVPVEPGRIGISPTMVFEPNAMRQATRAMVRGDEWGLRGEIGDFVNLFWPNLIYWSGMLWDSRRFPTMKYELNVEDGSMMKEMIQFFPSHTRLLLRLLMPKNFSKVKHMKKIWKPFLSLLEWERSGIVQYLDEASKTDEHYFRIYENLDCWGFGNVGATMASYLPSTSAGMCMGLESLKGPEREWNAVETKCIGLGDPYCEFKLVPGEIDELRDSLEKDSSVVEKVRDNLMGRLVGFLIDGKPLVERPRLGSDIQLHAVGHAIGFPYLAGERYQMALRMGGAKAGKEVCEHLMDAGMGEDQALKRVQHLLEHCKVGKVSVGETIRVKENCEIMYTKFMKEKPKEPSCCFTTGFFNGFFSALRGEHVRETKCLAKGDPYCEWEIV